MTEIPVSEILPPGFLQKELDYATDKFLLSFGLTSFSENMANNFAYLRVIRDGISNFAFHVESFEPFRATYTELKSTNYANTILNGISFSNLVANGNDFFVQGQENPSAEVSGYKISGNQIAETLMPGADLRFSQKGKRRWFGKESAAGAEQIYMVDLETGKTWLYNANGSRTEIQAQIIDKSW